MAILLAGAVRGTDLTAVLSQVEGNVTVKEEAPRRRSSNPGPPIRQARFLQVVRAGDEIRVPAEAGAGLVCSNDRWIALPQGMESRLTQDLCLQGKPLPPGTYKKLAPVGGRFQSVEGALVLERNTRAPEDELFGAPTLLSPRNTSLLDARPEIVWTSVKGAIEYEIALEGSKSFRVRLDASETRCDRSGDDWGEIRVCSLPWPDSIPDLPSEEIVFLSVGARHGLASPLRKDSESSRIQRLTEERAEEVRSSLEKLRDLPLECEARQLLEADVYARAGVFSEAISGYRKALVHWDAPESRITLGDVYLAVGLLRSAAHCYRAALESNPDSAVQAAAEFGLGKVEYARQYHEQAIPHFQRARNLYVLAGLEAEAKVAGRALAESVDSDKSPDL
jgi:hypothetical protein